MARQMELGKQISENVAIHDKGNRREVLIQIDGEWLGDWRMNDYRSPVQIIQDVEEDAWHPTRIVVNYVGDKPKSLVAAIDLASSIADDWRNFWEDPEIWIASRSRQRKQMRSEVQFFLHKFFLPSTGKLEPTNTLELRSTPKLLGFGVSDSYEICAIAADFDSETISITTEISNRGAVRSLPIDCSLGELKKVIRSQVDSILERLAEDVRSDVENFSGEEKT